MRPGYIAGASGNAALIGFTQARGAGTPKDNVRVFAINLSATLTDRIETMARVRASATLRDPERWEEVLDQSRMPFGRIKRPDEVGALAAMLCAPQVHYLSGAVIDLDGAGQWAGSRAPSEAFVQSALMGADGPLPTSVHVAANGRIEPEADFVLGRSRNRMTDGLQHASVSYSPLRCSTKSKHLKENTK